MAYTLRPDSLNTRTKIIGSVVLFWRILLRARGRGTHTKNICPLLKRLIVVLGRQRRVRRAVPKLCGGRTALAVFHNNPPGTVTYACAAAFHCSRDTSLGRRHPNAQRSRYSVHRNKYCSKQRMHQTRRQSIQLAHQSTRRRR